MSATLGGVGAVSSAITNRPSCLAWLRAAFTALPFVVIRIPLSPRAIALSIAVIWVWVSPSELPAATVRCTLSLAAAACASFSIVTKYGLDRVLRMSEMPTDWREEPEEDGEDAADAVDPPAAGPLDELDELQAVGAARPPWRRGLPAAVRLVELSMV